MSKELNNPAEVHFWRRLALQVGAGILILALVLFGITKGYVSWRNSSIIKESRRHFASKDYISALIAVRRVISANPAHPEANELAANIADQAGHPDAVDWRQRVVELNPGSVPHLLALARTAVKFQRFDVAEKALQSIPESQRNQADYQQLSGGVAVGLGRPKEAGKFYAEALRLSPESEQHRFNRANWELRFGAPETRPAALKTIQSLVSSPAVGNHARRALVTNAIESRDTPAALEQSFPVVQSDSATDADWILHLDLLFAAKDARLETQISKAQAQAAARPLLTVALLNWLIRHERAAAAVEWGRALDARIAGDVNVRIALADSAIAARDWPRVVELTEKGDWKERDLLRITFLAKGLREQGLPGRATNQWIVVASLAHREPDQVNQLLVRLDQWGWANE